MRWDLNGVRFVILDWMGIGVSNTCPWGLRDPAQSYQRRIIEDPDEFEGNALESHATIDYGTNL